MSAEEKRAALVDCEQTGAASPASLLAATLPVLFEVAQASGLTLDMLQGALGSEEELAAVDRQGNTALHHLCRNRSATTEMAQLLLERSETLAAARNTQGDTALSCLLAAACTERPRIVDARFSPCVELELLQESKQVSTPASGLGSAAVTAALDETLGVGSWWELTVLQGAEGEGGGDAEICLGALCGMDPSGSMEERMVGLSTKSGKVDDRAAGYDSDVALTCICTGDTLRFEIGPDADVAVKLNGVDCGVRFAGVSMPLRPAVRFVGSAAAGCSVALGSVSKAGQPYPCAASIVDAMVETDPSVLHVMDSLARLPVKAITQLQVLPGVIRSVVDASVKAGVVWCGSPETAEDEQYGVHVLLHSLGKKTDSKDARELDVRWCMDNMPKAANVCNTTRLHGLPFQGVDVQSVVCGLSHVVFLLKTGQVYRLRVSILQKKSAKPAAEIPERVELRECQAIVTRHHEVLRRLKKAADDAKKIDYGVDENEVQTLVEITAKSTDECRMVVRRIKPGMDRLELAMNILMGFAAMNAGSGSEYLLGDDVGRAQFELEQEGKRVQPYERRLRDLTRVVNDHERRQKAALQVYTADTLVKAGALQEWKDAPCTFTALAAMHSNLLALGDDGVLYAWAWASGSRGRHCRAAALCAPDDPIVSISASSLRASVLTAGGKVASWMDDLCHVAGGGESLELDLNSLPEPESEQLLEEVVSAEDAGQLPAPVWEPEFLACHNDAGAWSINGNFAELRGGRNYCVAVTAIPFPTTGRHTCVVRVCRAPENMAVGLVKSFADVSKHAHTSKGWIGNGPHGWCLFKDGDAAHNGSWKGGSYSQYAVSEGGTVGVTFDADKRSVCFESNGRSRENIFTDLPAQVYLAVSLYKEGKVELVSSDFHQSADPTTAVQGPERLLFGEGAGVILDFSSEDCGRGVDNLRRGGRRAESWVSKSHAQEHVTIDFGAVASVERVVLKPYYSKKYALQYLCATTGRWLDYQPWIEVEEGDDLPFFELNRVVETRQMKLLVDEGRKSSWKFLNIHGRARHGGSSCAEWDVHFGPLALCEVEHEATNFTGREGEKIERIVACDKGTVAVTSAGNMYWWGFRPWLQRRATMDAVMNGDSAKFRRLFYTCVTTHAHADEKKPISAPEMLLCLGAPDASFQEWISEVGHDSEQGETLTKLRDLYALAVLELQAGDIVVNCAVQQSLYSAGAKVVFMDSGTPTVVELAEDIPDLHVDKVTFKRCSGVSLQLELDQVVFLSAENRSMRYRILAVDPSRGVVVAQPLDATDMSGLPPAAEILDVVDVAPLSCIDAEAVYQEPTQVFTKTQAVADPEGPLGKRFDAAYQYYYDYTASTDLEPASKEAIFDAFMQTQETFHDAKSDGGDGDAEVESPELVLRSDTESIGGTDFVGDGTEGPPSPASSLTSYTSVNAGNASTAEEEFGLDHFAALLPAELMTALELAWTNVVVEDVVIDGWRVIATLWDGATLFRYVADLTSSEWKLDGVRSCDQAGAGPMLCVSDTESLMLEVDERGFLCSASAARLPRVELCGIGKVVAPRLTVDHTAPTAVALMVVALEPAARPTGLGFGGRNVLHSAAYASDANVEDVLLSLHDEQGTLAELLIQRDCRGATPFFVAMEKQDLAGAVAIKHCARLAGLEEESLLPPNFFGTPPLHALLGLGRGTSASLRKKLSSSVHLLSDLLVDPVGDMLVQSCDSAGLSVFAAFVTCPVRPEACRDLATAIVAVSPLAVTQCVKEGDDEEVDEFVYALIECGGHECQLVCNVFLECVVRFDEDRGLTECFVESCVRVYVSLFATPVGGRGTNQDTLMHILSSTVPYSVPLLAKVADEVVGAIRLGFPLEALEKVSTDSVSAKVPKTHDSGHLPDYVEPVEDDSMRDAAEYVHARVTTVPNKSSSIWFWFHVPSSGQPNFDSARLEFKYRRDSAGAWKTWSNPAVNAGNGWWHTPNWIRGSGTEWENSVWLDGDVLLRDVREPADDKIDDPPEGSHPLLRAHDKPSAGKLYVGGTTETAKDVKEDDEDSKLSRAQVFHLCVITISVLMEAHEEQCQMLSIEMGVEGKAMQDAAALLQTSWEHVFDVCTVLEARVAGQTGAQQQGRFGRFVASAGCQTTQAPTTGEISYVAFMLDALCRFKQVLPDAPIVAFDPPPFSLGDSPSRSSGLSRASSAPMSFLGSPERTASFGRSSFVGSPSSPRMVKSVSMMQRESPSANQDTWSARRRQQLLKGSGIEPNQRTSSNRSVIGKANEATERVMQRNFVQCSLLTALSRWTKTMELMSSVTIDADSMFTMLEPFDKKEQRFRKRIADRVLALPKDDPKIHMSIRRGPTACDGVLRSLITTRQSSSGVQPLCRAFDDKKPWFSGEMGEGKGPIREMVLLVAQSVKSSSGGMSCLFKPSPGVTTSTDGMPWWQVMPFGRVVPMTAKERITAEAEGAAEAAAMAAKATESSVPADDEVSEGMPPALSPRKGEVTRVLFDGVEAEPEPDLEPEPQLEAEPEPEPEPAAEPEPELELELEPAAESEPELVAVLNSEPTEAVPAPAPLQPRSPLIEIESDSDDSDLELELQDARDEMDLLGDDDDAATFEIELEAQAAAVAVAAGAAAASAVRAVADGPDEGRPPPAGSELATALAAEDASRFAASAASVIDAAFAAMLQSPDGPGSPDAAKGEAGTLSALSAASVPGWSSRASAETALRREELLAWMQGMQQADDKDDMEFLEELSALGASERAKKEVLLQAYAELAATSQELEEEVAVPPHAAAAAAEKALASAASRPRVLDRRNHPYNVDLDVTGLRACATADDGSERTAFPCLLRSTTPFNKAADGNVAYYEVTVINGGTANIVGVGLISPEQKPRRQPGWDRGAFGYHSDDGYLYAQQSSERAVQQKADTFGSGDVVGCGVVFSRATGLPLALFWTKNGVLLDMQVVLDLDATVNVDDVPTTPWVVPVSPRAADAGGSWTDMPAQDFYAGIGLDKPGTEVEVNFGAKPFLFDIAAHSDLDAAAAAAATQIKEAVASEGADVEVGELNLAPVRALPQPDDILWRYRCLGNIIGLCLLHGGEQYDLRLPLYFSRHVYKFLLRRRVEFADYAYHDPEAHANLMKIVEDSNLILAGQPVSEGGMRRLVAPDDDYWMLEWDESIGVDVSGATPPRPVTPEDAHAYVTQKATFEMIGSVRTELTAMRTGVYDVISEDDVRSLTADDLQLLLSGTGTPVCYADFREAAVFRDAREEAVRLSDGGAGLVVFESVFWEALASMSEMELLKLAEFWTASVTALPSKAAGGGMVINLVDLELNEKGGETTVISARTCTNELTVPDYRVTGRELAQRLFLLLEAYEVLPQFDTI